MANEALVKKLVEHLRLSHYSLSEDDVKRLLVATTNSIDQSLNRVGGVDVGDFGNFRRRKTSSSSYTNFKPTERVIERIKQGK